MSFSLEEQVLAWYNVPHELAQALCDLLRIQFAYGNSNIQMALEAMSIAMRHKILDNSLMSNEIQNLKTNLQQAQALCKELQETNKELQKTNKELQETNKELQETNEQLNADSANVLLLQVIFA